MSVKAKPNSPLWARGDLHAAKLASDGIDDVHRNAAGAKVNAQVEVGEVGAGWHILAVDRPSHATRQADLQRHIPARQLFKPLLVQLGLACAEGDLHDAAGPGVLDFVDSLLAGGLGGRDVGRVILSVCRVGKSAVSKVKVVL